jgi:hypothetical protein
MPRRIRRVSNQLRAVEKTTMRMATGQREASNKNNSSMAKKGLPLLKKRGIPRILVRVLTIMEAKCSRTAQATLPFFGRKLYG